MASARRPSPPAARETGGSTAVDPPLHPACWAVPALHMAALALVILAFTPLTLNLDDIKVRFFYWFGPALAVLALAAMAIGAAPTIPKIVGWPLLAYGLTLVVSTLRSEYSWAGWPRTMFFASGFGFFLGGVAIGAHKKASEAFLVFIVVTIAAVTAFGFFQYDVFGTGKTGMTWVWDALTENDRPRTASIRWYHHVSYTFAKNSRQALMSTILNRDFYAGFLLLYYPFCLTLALLAPLRRGEGEKGEASIRRRSVMDRGAVPAALGYGTTLLALMSIFLCKSKGEYFFAVGSIALFATLYFTTVRRLSGGGGTFRAWAMGVGLFLATLLVLKLPGLMGQLKTLEYSVTSRRIIFSGAWSIFKDFPILGSGPGTFRIRFPEYRDDEYFMHEISNVTIFAHNYFMDILSETGLAGFITYGAFGLAIAFLAFGALYRSKSVRLRMMLIASLCGLFGLYGSNMTSPNARWPIGAVGLYTVLGLTLGLAIRAGGWKPASRLSGGGRLSTRGPGFGEGPGRFGRLAAIGLGAMALAAAIVAWREGEAYWDSAVAYNRGKQPFQILVDQHGASVSDNMDAERERQVDAKLRECAASFRQAIEIYPNNASAYYQLGSVLNIRANLNRSEEGRFLREAEKAYLDLEKLWPLYSELPFNLGVIYYRLSFVKRAELTAATGISTAERMRANEEIKRYDDLSLAYFEKMKGMSLKDVAILNLGDAYFDAANHDATLYERALEAFGEGMRRYPRWSERGAHEPGVFARKYVETAEMLRRDREKAVGMFELWKVQPAKNEELLFPAMRIALEGGHDDLMGAMLEEAFRRNPVEPAFHEWRMRFARAQGDRATAVVTARRYAKLEGPDDAVLRAGAEAAAEWLEDETSVESGAMNEARAFHQAVVEMKRDSPVKEAARRWLRDHPG